MITDNGKYYIYRYTRNDTNQPFYIGIGSKRKRNYGTYQTEYERAFSKVNRNEHFLNIIKSVDYTIEIILETNSLDFLKQKEIELIKLYGRIDLKTGSLVNLTNGGDGHYNMSAKKRANLSKLCTERFKGKPLPETQRIKKAQSQIGRVHESKSIEKRTATRKYNAEKRGYYVPLDKVLKESISILQYDKDMNLIKVWTSIREAARELKLNHTNIINVCKNKPKCKTAGGFIWRYKVV